MSKPVPYITLSISTWHALALSRSKHHLSLDMARMTTTHPFHRISSRAWGLSPPYEVDGGPKSNDIKTDINPLERGLW